MNDEWDVAIVGAGPAGLAAAEAAVRAGARTIVLERAVHPRYKTCGGGLIGASLAALRDDMPLPARDHIGAATFTLRGKRTFTRRIEDVLLTMVSREEFDDALRRAATEAGAVVRQRSAVRSIGQDDDRAYARLADGTEMRAKVLVGADGSAGFLPSSRRGPCRPGHSSRLAGIHEVLPRRNGLPVDRQPPRDRPGDIPPPEGRRNSTPAAPRRSDGLQPGMVISCHRPPFRLMLLPWAWPGAVSAT
jgi:flavin-dependent dehydrogenase